MTGYNIQLEKLCKTLQLGELIHEPQELTGGLIHKMVAMQTTTSKYAVKALNPKVIARPEALQNIINSEKIACIVSGNINAFPAKIYNDKAVQEIDGQYYLVFDWCDGKNIFGDDITAFHCEKIGQILAIVHKTDFTKLGLADNYTDDEPVPDWNSYLKKGIAANAPWVQIVRDNIEKLYDYSNLTCSAAKILSENTVITHCDLEPKNVLWQDKTPYLIDWEAAGFVNPMHDLVETAVYWSKDNNGQLVKNKFLALIQGYKSIISNLQSDWSAVLDKGFSGLLGWLEYSLKRSLWIECTDEVENKMGTEHVSGTICNINKYAEDKKMLSNWLKEV
jgi:thiamine kinase-like enzyme